LEFNGTFLQSGTAYALDGEQLFPPAPGPNNPVGSTWIDLGDGYGIHGTPEPQRISKSESHGCVRLTNWDAHALGKMVHKGTKVEFIN
jgi:lipoprotein-anchoring transpeptidase ErfK/SrfK